MYNFIILCFFTVFISCNIKSETYQTLKIKALDGDTNKPLSFQNAKVKVIDKSIILWGSHTILDTITDSLGVFEFNIDRNKRYRVIVESNQGRGYATDEFEGEEINMNEVYIIKSLKSSEIDMILKNSLARELDVKVLDKNGKAISNSKFSIAEIKNNIEPSISDYKTDSNGISKVFIRNCEMIEFKIPKGTKTIIKKFDYNEIDFENEFKIIL